MFSTVPWELIKGSVGVNAVEDMVQTGEEMNQNGMKDETEI